MKDISTQSGIQGRLREVVTSLVVLSVVLVVPVFSLVEFGHFFRGNDSRSAAALPAMTTRAADKTSQPVQAFKQPLITVTFDDGFESIYTDAMPLLQKYGIHSTQYVLAGTEKQTEYISWKQIDQMHKAGHEIACHSMTHPDLTTLNDSDLKYQLSQCKAEVSKRYGEVTSFASPYGAQNDHTLAAISKYFDSQRNTNGDPKNGVTNVDVNTAANFDRLNIIGVTIQNDTTVKQLQELVAYAKLTNGWVVVTYHQADDKSGSKFSINTQALDKQLAYLSSTDVRIATMHDVIASTSLKDTEF